MPEALFVGREREQDVYKKFLARETPWVLIIIGLGGIGKTTLQRRLAKYTFSESILHKRGVITLDFANEELRNDPLKLLDKLTTDTAPFCDVQRIDSDFNEVLQQNIDQLAQLSVERAQTGVSESEDPALREIHHQMRELATEAFYTQIKTFKLSQLVIMLDTCEWLNEPEGIEVGQWVLNELIPGLHTRIRQQGRQCHVLMFSRLQLRLDVINGRDQQRLTLPMLGKAEVDQYLEHMGMQDADLRQRVYEVTHGHALCVSIIGDFWQQREAQKEPFTIADLPELQVQEFSEIALMQFTNERVLKQLKSPFKELTRYGVLLRSFDLPLLRNVFPELLPEAESLEIFNQLIRYPYIESRGNYRYAFHELLREALSVVTQKEEPEEWKACHKLALDYLTKVSPHSPDRYYHLLAYDEKQGLVEWQQAIQQARERGKREFTGALLQAALDEALHLSPAAQAEVSYEQGRFNYYGVQWEEALKSYNEALAFFRQEEDYSGQAKVLQAIGDVQRTLGKQDEALLSYEQALALFLRLGDQLGEARCCQAMGDVQRLRKDLDAALQCYEQCLGLFKQLKDRSEEAKALEAIGDVQQLGHNLEAALHSYEQALALYQEEKDRLKRAKVLKSIGDVQRLRREKNAALESYGQALALFGELKEPVEEANVRREMEEMQQPESRQGLLLESTTPHYATQEHTAIPGSVPVAPQPIITPEPVLPQPKDESSRGISRRSVMVGLLGLATVAVAGGAAWLIVSKQNPFVFGSGAPPIPTSRAVPVVVTSLSNILVTVTISEDQNALYEKSIITLQFTTNKIPKQNYVIFINGESIICNGIPIKLNKAVSYSISMNTPIIYSCDYYYYLEGKLVSVPIFSFKGAQKPLSPVLLRPVGNNSNFKVSYTPDFTITNSSTCTVQVTANAPNQHVTGDSVPQTGNIYIGPDVTSLKGSGNIVMTRSCVPINYNHTDDTGLTFAAVNVTYTSNATLLVKWNG